MDQEYDVVVLGTGLTECILSGILSMEGKKVLHLDRNSYYGGECASLNLSQLFDRFRNGVKPPVELGRDRDYALDLVPKFMMASSDLVDILVNTDVTRYLEFVQVEGSFVFKKGSGICKVPSTPLEAASSSLMGFFEKRRAKSFFEYVQEVRADVPSTWNKHPLGLMPFGDLCKQVFGLDDGTIDFIGHALALHLNDAFIKEPALPTILRIQQYMHSMLRYGKSPYVYPLYGLGELPQGFARLSAIYGGTYMLNCPFDGILYDEQSEGKVCGVQFEYEGQKMQVRCKAVFADPSYLPECVRLTHQVVRCIVLLSDAIPGTNGVDSCQIIIPQNQVGRHYDLYIACLSSSHSICPPGGIRVAFISTIMETEDPDRDIAPALNLLGSTKILQKFVWVQPLCEPDDEPTLAQRGLFISRSPDATSHFATLTDDVKRLYRAYSSKDWHPTRRPTSEEEQAALQASYGSITSTTF